MDRFPPNLVVVKGVYRRDERIGRLLDLGRGNLGIRHHLNSIRYNGAGVASLVANRRE
jgi:hypothetical protein